LALASVACLRLAWIAVSRLSLRSPSPAADARPGSARRPERRLLTIELAAAMPLRAVGIGARCPQRLLAGSYASFDAKLRE